jgi:predicted HAD superfamily phosphohydrolase YqeG
MPTTEAVQAWLTTATEVFGARQILILSNKPMAARIQWFATTYPEIRWIRAARKKPYPDGLLQICQQLNYQPQQVILADDRLLTGGLATCLAGTQFLYIQQPYVQISKRPVDELFFMSLRYLERLTIKVLNIFQ